MSLTSVISVVMMAFTATMAMVSLLISTNQRAAPAGAPVAPVYNPPPPRSRPENNRRRRAQRPRSEDDPQSTVAQNTNDELPLQPAPVENRADPVGAPVAPVYNPPPPPPPPIFRPVRNREARAQRPRLEDDEELPLQPAPMEDRDLVQDPLDIMPRMRFQRRDEGLRRRPKSRMIAAIPAAIVVVLGVWYLRSSGNTSVNFAALEKDYSTNVFGQHLVAPVILKAVPDFWNNTNPQKPLVLSFHGWTGGGKNLVSQILVRNLYPAEAERKKCVQLFDVIHHFSPEENKAKDAIKQRIHGTVKKCERAIFIFDEMDKMPPGLIDVIKPYLDTYEQLDGLSFRKCIFIFLSNAGGEKITELALEFWRNKKKREDIKLSDVESHLSKHAFNKKGGFWHSSLIDRNLIDVFVPFLPLEEEHVRMCVRAELRQRDRAINEELVTKIAGEMSYYPEKERVYSVKGCKTVATKISLFL